jgi:peptidyl-prolyl cis-trans isomerase C
MAARMRPCGNRILRAAALFACATLALTACSQASPFKRPPEPGDAAVATFDGQKIWASDVKREAVAQGLIGEGEPLDTTSDLFRQVLDEVVDQKLLAAEAVKRKIDKQPLAQRRIAAARERILGDMLVQSTVAKAVNDHAIQSLYAEQLRLARGSDEIRARQIVTHTPAEGEAVKKTLTGGAAFETLAMDKSIDPNTRFNGGDLGYFTLDVMPPAYGAALKDAKVGDLIGPFQVEGGYALVKVEDRRQEKPITLQQARPQIVRFLTYDQVRELLERLRGKAKVKVLLPPQQTAPREPASAPAAAPALARPAPSPASSTPPLATPPGGSPPRKSSGGAAPPGPGAGG